MSRRPHPRIPLRSLLILLTLFAGCAQDRGNEEAAERWLEKKNAGDESAGDKPGEPSDGAGRSRESAAGAPHAVESDALIVNDEAITVDDILEPVQPEIEELARTLTGELYYRRVLEIVRQQIVDAVAQHLIYRRASRTITEEMEPQVKKAVEQMERDRIGREFHGRETEYENYLQKKRRTRDQVKERLRKSLVVDEYIRGRLRNLIPEPNRYELEQYYEAHKQDYAAPAYRELYLIDVPIAGFYDRDILLMRRPPLPEEERAAEKKARETIELAMTDLKNGEKFEDVAKRYSNGPHKDDGGYWGRIRSPMAGRWTEPYAKFVQMKSGETSDIIEAAKSYFIVRVGEIQEESYTPFESLQYELGLRIKNERFQRLKADFLQKELDDSTLGPLDKFVGQVMAAVPKPHDEDPTVLNTKLSSDH